MGYLRELIDKVPYVSLTKIMGYMLIGGTRYELLIKKFFFVEFLRSLTGIYIDNYQYTTFAEEITGVRHPKIKYKDVVIGFDNTEHYVHVPDFLATLILTRYTVKAYVGGSLVVFWATKIRTTSIYYSLGERVRTPFYTWETNPKFSDNLELILYLIGYADVIKRNGGVILSPAEIEANKKFKMYYFLPTLYTAYYLRNKHTFIESPDVITQVYKEVESELKVPRIPFDKLIRKANVLMEDDARALFER